MRIERTLAYKGHLFQVPMVFVCRNVFLYGSRRCFLKQMLFSRFYDRVCINMVVNMVSRLSVFGAKMRQAATQKYAVVTVLASLSRNLQSKTRLHC